MAKEYCAKCEENIKIKEIIFPKDEDLCPYCRSGVRYYYIVIGLILIILSLTALFNPFYTFNQTDGFPSSLNPWQLLIFVFDHDSTTPREMLMALYPLFSLVVAMTVSVFALVRYFKFAYMTRMVSALTSLTFFSIFAVGALWESFQYGLWARVNNEYHRELAASILNNSSKSGSYYLIIAIWIILFIYSVITFVIESTENGRMREQKIKVNTINKSSFKNTPAYIADKKRDNIVKHVRENIILDVIEDAEKEYKKVQAIEEGIAKVNKTKSSVKKSTKKTPAKKPTVKKTAVKAKKK